MGDRTGGSPERPAFYALAPGGWRDWWSLLHPPYTVWHLSYVVIGASLARDVDLRWLGETLLAFLLAMGLAALLTVDEPAIELRRRAKTPVELEGIRIAQRAAEAGMAAASDLLARSRSNADGRLEIDDRPLLAEDVRAVLRQACAQNGAPCPPDVIVASVWQGNGHEPGSGPLPAGLPIHVDVWPRHEETACWADMARTFVVGEPAPEHAERLAEMESISERALSDAKDGVRPGVKGRELFDATCELFESAGYPTQRTSEPDEHEGFQWALGHGVGLEVHEPPSVGLAGRDPFVVGDVVALEPGLSDEQIGGVVLEDLVVVTEDGCEVLTSFPYDFAPTRA